MTTEAFTAEPSVMHGGSHSAPNHMSQAIRCNSDLRVCRQTPSPRRAQTRTGPSAYAVPVHGVKSGKGGRSTALGSPAERCESRPEEGRRCADTQNFLACQLLQMAREAGMAGNTFECSVNAARRDEMVGRAGVPSV